MNGKISNNLVIKFDKNIEYPKSLYRGQFTTILEDHNTSYIFAGNSESFDEFMQTEEGCSIVNLASRHKNVLVPLAYVNNRIKPIVKLFFPYNLSTRNLYHGTGNTTENMCLQIFVFSVNNNQISSQIEIPEVFRNVIYEFGIEVSKKILTEFKQSESDYNEDTYSIYKEESLEIYNSQKTLFDRIKDFFSSNDESAEYCKTFEEFIKDEPMNTGKGIRLVSDLNLSLVEPLLNEFIYQKLTSEEQKKYLSGGTFLVLNIANYD